MASSIKYPLIQVLEIKKKRVTEAEKVVAQKRKELATEQEKLKECEKARDEVVRHKQDKLNQLRDELDGGTTSPKVLQMKAYIEVVKERVAIEEKKVRDQKERVKVAEQNLADAIKELDRRRQEVEKFETHKADWTKMKRRELEFEEEKMMDEVGQTLYTVRQRKQQ